MCAIVGGYVSGPPNSGRYLYGDVCSGGLRSVRLTAGGAWAIAPNTGRCHTSCRSARDGGGRIYAVGLNGRVYRAG